MAAHKIDVILSAIDKASSPLNRITGGFNLLSKAGLAAGATFAIVSKGVDLAISAFNALVQGIKDGIANFRSFETSMAKVKSLLSDMDESFFPSIQSEIKQMSLVFGKSAVDLANAYTLIQKKGFDAKDSLEILRNASVLAIATFTDEDVAASSLADTLSTYNFNASQSAYVTNILAIVSKNTKTSLEEMGSIIARLAPISQAYNINLEQLAGMMTVLSDKGFPVKTMMGSLTNAINNMVSPSEKQIETASSLGLAWDDLDIKAYGVVGMFNRMKDAAGTNTDALRQLVGGAQELNIALALTGDTKFNSIVTSFKSNFDEINKMYVTATSTTEFQLNRQKTIQENFSQSAGEALSGLGLAWDEFWLKMQFILGSGGIAQGLARYELLMNQAKESTDKLFQIDKVSAYVGAIQSLDVEIKNQENLLPELIARTHLYERELTQLTTQKEIIEQTHAWNEALRYIPMALEDATYTSKIYNATINGTYYNIQALVDSIRIQRDEIQRLQDVNDAYSLSSQKNSLQEMIIQRAAMNQRHGMTRTQKRMMAELQKTDLDYRIAMQQNQIQINTIKQGGLTADERNLDSIKMGLNEQVYLANDAYQRELSALQLQIDAKNLLITSHKDTIKTVYGNINTLTLEKQAELLYMERTFNEEEKKLFADLYGQSIPNALTKSIMMMNLWRLAQKANVSETAIGNVINRANRLFPVTPTNTQEIIENAMETPTPQPSTQKTPGFWETLFANMTFLQGGGIIERTGMAVVHKGETVIPANKSGGTLSVSPITVNLNAKLTSNIDINRLGQKLAEAVASGIITGVESKYTVG